MISRTTENVASTDELTEAFRSLTEGGDKPYITASELYAAMPPDQVRELTLPLSCNPHLCWKHLYVFQYTQCAD